MKTLKMINCEAVLSNPISVEMLETKSMFIVVARVFFDLISYTMRASDVVENALRDLGPTIMVYGARAYS